MTMEKGAMGRPEIRIEAELVKRPEQKWSPNVQKFLGYLRDQGVEYVPKPLGIDDSGNEIVSYVSGEVYNYPLPAILLNDQSIISAGQLLKDFHDRGVDFLGCLEGQEVWMLTYEMPHEVMCHSDFAPYNVTTVDGLATGIIDFDTLMPGTRLWDIVYGAYRWVPLYFDETTVMTREMSKRLKLFLEAYGLSKSEYTQVVPYLIKRLTYLIQFMEEAAQRGERNFQGDLINGHIEKYQRDIKNLEANEARILTELNKDSK